MDTVARVTISLRASLYGLPASTRSRLTMNPATDQCAQRRDRTNVFMCHLDHLLQLPWADDRRVPPTKAARPKPDTAENDLNCAPSEDFKALRAPAL